MDETQGSERGKQGEGCALGCAAGSPLPREEEGGLEPLKAVGRGGACWGEASSREGGKRHAGHPRFWRHQLLRSISAFLGPEREMKSRKEAPLPSTAGEGSSAFRVGCWGLWKQPDLSLSPSCVT